MIVNEVVNITYDYQVFALQAYGGVSRYFYELCSRLELQTGGAMQSNILAPLHINNYIKNLPGRQLKTMAQVKAFRGSWLALQPFNHAASILKNRFKTPNLLHETYYAKQTTAPKNCPIVLTVYDMVHELFEHTLKTSDSTTMRKRLAVDRADHLICISESTKQDLMRLFGTDEKKISVIHLGFSINGGAIANEIKLTALHRKPFILHVGSRAGYKNFAALLQAYAASAQLRKDFNLISFGSTSFNADEMMMLQKLGIQDNVHFASGNDQQLAQYYQTATIFVYPSLYEGFGIPPLEAMHFGCPVACSNTSSMPEVVGNAAKLFDPKSVESMREGMEQLLTLTDVREKQIKLGHERLKMFSWDKCTLETAHVYKKLL